MDFKLCSEFRPMGDQPQAILELSRGLSAGQKHQLLLGATGTGKTFTIAHVIEAAKLPTLVLAPNKTLAGQLYTEFKALFPENAVEYFVSYYDYYQPEAYVPTTDTFIEKDALINDEIDRMRHSATRSLLERSDVLVVASVSCIYGIGASEIYEGMTLELRPGMTIARNAVIDSLVELRYTRNDHDFSRGHFRVRGDVVDVFPVYEEDRAIRLSWFGDELESIDEIDPLRGRSGGQLEKLRMFPASHYVTPPDRREAALKSIAAELEERLQELESASKLLEAQRLEQRTRYDLEMLETVGMVKGIENYARHLSQRAPGEPPPTLIDYFPDDFLLVADESHVMIPQVGAMYQGDRTRKETLVAHGFRLPSALDNRPLKFKEFEAKIPRAIFVSATPADYELEATQGVFVEQIIRPTGLLDPIIEVRPVHSQVDDLLAEVRLRSARNERTLVTTLTKRMAEDLTEYFASLGVKVQYLHADIDTLERADILRDLRMGVYEVVVGINLLREGLDLPEVSLVAILDADKEGFLRAERSLIQTIGRAARNAGGKVIMYGDRITRSMKAAIEETDRRRQKQEAYNQAHGITPRTIQKRIDDLREVAGLDVEPETRAELALDGVTLSEEEAEAKIVELRRAMKARAAELKFEAAAEIRDQIRSLEAGLLGLAAPRRRNKARVGRKKPSPKSR